MELTKQDLHSLALGSTLLATGGGFPFESKHQKLQELNKNNSLHLISTNDLCDDDLVCAISGIGSAGNTQNLNFDQALIAGLKTMQGLLGQNINALIPGEIGIENIIFELASKLNLPVLDADTAGGRAVPEMTHDTFFLADETILPVVFVSLTGKTFVIDNIVDERQIEKLARTKALETPEKTILIFSHGKPIHKIKAIASLDSLSRSIEIGTSLKSQDLTQILQDLKNICRAELITTAKVTSVFKNKDQDFLKTIVTLRTPQGIMDLIIKNEILALQQDSNLIAHIPDLICLLDLKTFLPIHSSEIEKGSFFAILRIPAIKQWQTEKARELFGISYLKNTTQ
ncbi:MAG: hypothetical protein UT32_C0003G0020 [Parcubacteria group bacterium GW2011_GWC2_39_14]|nr:MAG: hypothetical protein UT32_C0003G0020 [Parcubacteria group bacterium GW2011_GWC2_39_14]KKR54969.1 MAG: hypothetical protein UT91_C0006G0020 [Parcubacteria group bacterium GW2011_GWA2_40_23]